MLCVHEDHVLDTALTNMDTTHQHNPTLTTVYRSLSPFIFEKHQPLKQLAGLT